MSLNNIFYTLIINYTQELSPAELSASNDTNTILLEKIKKNIGNKCSKEGYIKKDSIKLVERSLGRIISSHFNGDIVYDLKLEVNICNVVEGDIINCKVIGINKMGIMCEKKPLLIALSKIYHEDNLQRFENIEVGQSIDVEVVCSRFEYNDDEINVIAKLS